MSAIDGPVARVLEGQKVLDLGGALAGSLSAQLLAEQGAEVVAVRPPCEHAPAARLAYPTVRSTLHSLDLKSATGRAAAESLLREADVAIENFRPGVMERLGLGPEVVRLWNPRLVYLRLPGFPSADLTWRDVPGWEGALSAACGLFTDVNILRSVLGLPPVYTALAHCSIYGAVHGALGVCLALLARERSGAGDVIEVPLAAAGLSAMGSAAMRIRPQPTRYDLPELSPLVHQVLPALQAAARRLPIAAQQALERAAGRTVPALMSSYLCADGRQLYVFAVDHDRLPVRLLEALDLWPRLQREGLVLRDPYAAGCGTMRNNLADSTRLSARWQRRLRWLLSQKFRRRPAAEWENTLAAFGLACAVQRTTREWLALPELAQAGIVETVDDGAGTIRMPGPAAWVRDGPSTPPSVQASAPPLANSNPVGAEPRLAGHVVLDLSSMVAGPVCGRTLAEYGARVIKVDSPRPHHGPRLTCWYGVDVNQGKESILLDLGRPDGRAAFDRLLTQADILVHNFTNTACDRLKLHMADLLAANRRLVVARVGAFRGPRFGPLEDRKGYDPVLQAASGIMCRYGSAAEPVHHGIASCVDYLTGYLAAWSVALGLLRRARRGGAAGCSAATSLAQAATLIQLPYSVNDPTAPRSEESQGQWAWGPRALDRLYQTKDGWVYLAAPETACAAVCDALGIPQAVCAPGDDAVLTRALRRAIRSRSRAELSTKLWDSRVAIVPVDHLDQLCTAALEATPSPGSAVADAAGLRAIEQRGPEGMAIRSLVPTYARAGAAPLLHLAPAPRLGSDTRAVLAEYGASREEIDHLLRDGSAADGLNPHPLPE